MIANAGTTTSATRIGSLRDDASGSEAVVADPQATHVVQELKHDSAFVSCRFDPTGRFVFAGAQDATIARWDLQSGAKTSLESHESWPWGIDLTQDGQRLISGGYDGWLIAWDASAETPEVLWNVEPAHDGWIRAVAVSPRADLVATCGNDRVVRLWRIEDGSLVRELIGHEHHIYNVGFHPEGNDLVSCDLKGILKHWSVETGEQVKEFEASALYKYDKGFRADIGGARALAFRPDGTQIACAGITNVSNAFAGVGNPIAVRIDYQSGELIKNHLSSSQLRGVNWGAAFHPDGYLIGLSGGGGGGHLLFWLEDEVEEFATIKLKNSARAMDLHPDGLRIATAHTDGVLRINAMVPKA